MPPETQLGVCSSAPPDPDEPQPEEKWVVRPMNEESSLCVDAMEWLGDTSQEAGRARILLLADAHGPEV